MSLTTTETLQRISKTLTNIINFQSRQAGIRYDEERKSQERGQNERARIQQTRKANHIRQGFISEWMQQIHTEMFDFECSDEEVNYVTRPRDAVQIHTATANALGPDRCTTFIDAFACVGGDTLAAMYKFRDAEIFTVQKCTTSGERARCDRLEQNIATFKKMFPNRMNGIHPVSVAKIDIRSFLTEFHADISVLHLDPPWTMDRQITIEEFLETEVWTPLRANKIYPLIIVLKLPHPVTNIDEWPRLEIQYQMMDCVRPRGPHGYAVHILRRVDKPALPGR